MNSLFIAIIIYLIGLFLLYVVIETAVRRGINSSVIGIYLEKEHGLKEKTKPFSRNDLDND